MSLTLTSICKGERPEIIKNTQNDLENIITQWLKCVNEYYKLNDENDENAKVIYNVSSDIDNQFRSDMYEFVEANKALKQEQFNTSIIQFHPQAYYTSRLLTVILDQNYSNDLLGLYCIIEN
ncbi:hypothetical protein C1645_813319 [Glomus cerebriforme]|uniref:Uncharacterized protein n=1 Tax=Glomus cerebriforme TaxID=658196 RepID=A0A397TJE4_9GLOM|nr:hypothetical protein C1645_813319 [Glomus cerebriforme]